MHRQLLLVLTALTLAACGGRDRLEVTADFDPPPPDLAAPDLAAPDLASPDLAAPDLAAPDLAERVLSPRPCDCFGDLAPFRD